MIQDESDLPVDLPLLHPSSSSSNVYVQKIMNKDQDGHQKTFNKKKKKKDIRDLRQERPGNGHMCRVETMYRQERLGRKRRQERPGILYV